MLLFKVLLSLVLYARCLFAYIPAIPTNETLPVDLDDASGITMKFKPSNHISEALILLLTRPNSTGMAQGALVQFSEQGLTSDGTTTPWIALVSCDANATDFSTSIDIFTLASERGATGAIIYSETSEACQLNDEYLDLDPALDLYMPENKFEAQDLLMQFTHLPNASYIQYNSALLNESLETVQFSLASDTDVTSNFMIATLRAPDSFFANDTSTTPQHSSNPNTGLAMIILYAITGCVSALFIIVILSGAIRAIRHPERYGPRAAGVNVRGLPVGAQTRTGGLGRAILDTFPVIKFNQPPQTDPSSPTKDDLENSPVELSVRSPITDYDKDEKKYEYNSNDGYVTNEKHPSTPSSSKGPTIDDPEPSAMGHQTCPICILDFEKGDDVRVLPCEGRHQFHQACVDPWLLELSSSCPLCRKDFHALESVLSGGAAPEENNNDQAGRSHRFTGYLRFARRRRSMISDSGNPPS